MVWPTEVSLARVRTLVHPGIQRYGFLTICYCYFNRTKLIFFYQRSNRKRRKLQTTSRHKILIQSYSKYKIDFTPEEKS